jgi:diaminopimelate decarboxylase
VSSEAEDIDPSRRLPLSTRFSDDGAPQSIGGVPLADLASQYGTPLWIFDLGHIGTEVASIDRHIDRESIYFASKACSLLGVLAHVRSLGLSVDVSTEGELAAAQRAGFASDRILLHGNAKGSAEWAAVANGCVGMVVLDSAQDVESALGIAQSAPETRFLLRLNPGIDIATHASLNTARRGSKFGVPIWTGEATTLAARLRREMGDQFAGIHYHLGSQVARTSDIEEGAHAVIGWIATEGSAAIGPSPVLNIGGGYITVPPAPLGSVVNDVVSHVREISRSQGLPDDLVIQIEPGRSIVARAGATLYGCRSVKETGLKTPSRVVALDGGMSDNPRPALYGAAYSFLEVASNQTLEKRFSSMIAGCHCESGDVLSAGTCLSESVLPGSLLLMPESGAYHHSLASEYNRVPLPAAVAVADGTATLIKKRRSIPELFIDEELALAPD